MKLYSGYYEICPGKVVLLPYPMSRMEMTRWRFGPLIALPGLAAGAVGGLGSAAIGGIGGLASGVGGLASSVGGMVGGPSGIAKIGGTGMSLLGQFMGGQSKEADIKNLQTIADYNARVYDMQARTERQKALFEQKRQAKRGARVQSTLTAQLGAAGGLGSPVALDLAAEQATELELENLLLGYEGEIFARRAESQAGIYKLQSRIYKQQFEAQKKANLFGVGKSLLSGFGNIFS